jgi:hypothetical protein
MANHTADLRFGKTEISFQNGLDRANQLEPPQQIGFFAQSLEALERAFAHPAICGSLSTHVLIARTGSAR